MNSIPGWYQSPDNNFEERYWDGIRWTDQKRPKANIPLNLNKKLTNKSEFTKKILISIIVGIIFLVTIFLGFTLNPVDQSPENDAFNYTTIEQDEESENDTEQNITSESSQPQNIQASETPFENSQVCDPNYSGACVPIVPYDLDCPDIGQLVLVVGTDIHKFDRDRDGRACES